MTNPHQPSHPPQPGQVPQQSGHPPHPGQHPGYGRATPTAIARVSAAPPSTQSTLGMPVPASPEAAPAYAHTAPPVVLPSAEAGPDPSAGAAAAGQAEAAAQPAAVAAPASLVPAPPGAPPAPTGPGPEPQGSRTDHWWRYRRHRRIPRLRIGWHAADSQHLDQVQMSLGAIGLSLGSGASGEPTALRLFRPEPTRMLLIGDSWALEAVAFRALRFGARVVVLTQDPAGWIDLGRRATGRTDRVAVLASEAEVSMTATADSPVLRIVPPGYAGTLPEWTASATAVAPQSVPELLSRPELLASTRVAEIVVTQRLPPPSAVALAQAFGLPVATRDALPGLPDGVVAVHTGAGTQYLRLGPDGHRPT